jgi:large exoprotein involved in heme utilization and adhesion
VLSGADVKAYGFSKPSSVGITFEGDPASTDLDSLGTNLFPGGVQLVGGNVTLDRTRLDIGDQGSLSYHTGYYSSTATARLVGFDGVGEVSVANGADHLPATRAGSVHLQNGASISGVSIDVLAGVLTLDAGCAIQSGSILGSGENGPIHVVAREVDLGKGAAISGDAYTTGSDVHLEVGDLLRLEGGHITASTTTTGEAGEISNPGSIHIEGKAAVLLRDGATIEALRTEQGAFTLPPEFTRGVSGGNITIDARSLRLFGTRKGAIPDIAVTAGVGGTTHNGGLVLHLTKSLVLEGGVIRTEIIDETENVFFANVGNVMSVHAGSVTLDGARGTTKLFVQMLSAAAGATLTLEAGGLSITRGATITSQLSARASGLEDNRFFGVAGGIGIHAQALYMASGAKIESSALNGGKAGTVAVRVPVIDIDGTGLAPGATGIFSDSVSLGSASSVTVNARAVALLNGGTLSATTEGFGAGGSVSVRCNSLLLDGNAPAITAGTSGDGAGGSVSVKADRARLAGSGRISVGTSAGGAGGSVRMYCDALVLDGPDATITAETSGRGAGGSIALDTGTLKLAGEGKISAASRGTGAGGTVMLNAGSFDLGDEGQVSAASFGAGAGGKVVLQGGSLAISGAAGISASAAGSGAGGSVILVVTHGAEISRGMISAASSTAAPAGSVRLEADSLEVKSGGAILSSNTGGGAGGSVLLRLARDLKMTSGGTVSTQATGGDAGAITIDSADSISLDSGSRIVASAGRNGGAIELTAPGVVYVRDSEISATAGTVRTRDGAVGSGGNITIDPSMIVLIDDTISAAAPLGQGGNIVFDTPLLLNSGSDIRATGTVTLTGILPEANSIAVLPATLLDASTQIRASCAQRLGQEFSSFLLLGSGGVAESPDTPQASGRAAARAD